MDKVVQRLITQYAAIPIAPETVTKRHKIVNEIAWHNVYMRSGKWIDFTDGADLGMISPEGSARAMSRVAKEG